MGEDLRAIRDRRRRPAPLRAAPPSCRGSGWATCAASAARSATSGSRIAASWRSRRAILRRNSSAEPLQREFRRAPLPPLQVLGRMRSLGMKPALGGFSGHVPKAFADKYLERVALAIARLVEFPEGRPEDGRLCRRVPPRADRPAVRRRGRRLHQGVRRVRDGPHLPGRHVQRDDAADVRSRLLRPLGRRRLRRDGRRRSRRDLADAGVALLQRAVLLEGAAGRGVPSAACQRGSCGSSTCTGRVARLVEDGVVLRPPVHLLHAARLRRQAGLVGDAPTLANNGGAAIFNDNSTISGVGLTMEGIWTNYPMFEMTLQLGWQP